MRELVFDPLGLAHSTYEQPLPPALWDQAATGHYWVPDNPVAGQWHIYPEMAAAGLWTTPADLARVALALQAARAARPGAILAAELVAQMLTREMDDAGLGVFLHGKGEATWFGHDGDDHGFVATLKAYKDHGLGVAIMTNGYDGGSLIEELVNTIALEYDWPAYLPPVPAATPIDPAIYDAYVGEYELLPGAVWLIARDGATLTVTPPGQNPIPLYPQSDTTFFMRAAQGEITFAPAADEHGPELIFRQDGHELRARRR
jgi:CubicO group peptidase (beta-lactamase class C family)